MLITTTIRSLAGIAPVLVCPSEFPDAPEITEKKIEPASINRINAMRDIRELLRISDLNNSPRIYGFIADAITAGMGI
jgi:hypothetical protein